MKVKELIEELKKCDPEAELASEGCDCDNLVEWVDHYEDGTVYLRNDIEDREGK